MKLIVNGQAREAQASDLAALLAEMDYADRLVATALNGEFVPKDERKSAALADGDRIEILAPMKGG
ncbi:thiamine biosynthesis protein ThiS [Notoacmeibacter marinus]|uniref:Thiamine biosynthesis protein ThiS n=1 Tax=Notoacmeibacter marinus TaxID=1876515 RepID=A0A231V2X6_9HYPH|nr:sulfur carrier protein ThiS [Notoacmeibacter marinus]OXT02514.1 thiamine biosynthesis protein ThiS [Notoacmeibacter marinus]